MNQLLTALVIIGGILLLIESVFVSGIVKNTVSINANLIAGCILVFLLLVRLVYGFSLNSKVLTILSVSSLIAIALSGLALFIDLRIEPNYFYSQLHIFPNELFIFSFYSALAYLLLVPIKTAVRYSVIFFPLYTLVLFLFIRTYYPEAYFVVIGEDGPVETIQFLLFTISSIMSFVVSFFIYKKSRLLALAFVFAGFAFLLVAGEEISWGQRILNFSTPESIKATNTQEEFNLHNNVDFYGFNAFGKVYMAYVLISLYGFLSWIFAALLEKVTRFSIEFPWNLVIVANRLMLYFLIPLVYFYYRSRFDFTPGASDWEEVIELLLVLGITMHLLYSSLTSKKLAK